MLNPEATDPEATEAAVESSATVAVHSMESWNKHWTDHKDSNKLLVIDFCATWCGPCRFMEPVFEALATKFTQASFVKIDIDELPEVADLWKIQVLPTILMVKGGKEVSRPRGRGTLKDELEKTIAQLV